MKLGTVLSLVALFTSTAYLAADNPPLFSVNPPTHAVNPPTH